MGIKTESRWEFPPDVFWMDPDGKAIDIIGHLSAIQEKPSFFGVMFAPTTTHEINTVFNSLLSNGWVRGRMNDDRAYFQIWQVKNKTTLANIVRFVREHHRHIKTVILDVLKPPKSWELKASDFISGKRKEIL